MAALPELAPDLEKLELTRFGQPVDARDKNSWNSTLEEISTFENAVKLEPHEMLNTYLVRSLAPLVDIYVNDAFAAAHRNAPSMVAFQELKPTAAGDFLGDDRLALGVALFLEEGLCEGPRAFVKGYIDLG